MLCELCGAEVPRTKAITVEGTVLAACPDCARFGTETTTPAARRRTAPPVIADRLEARRRRMTPKDVYDKAGTGELAVDYPARIRSAREARGWKQADLGAKINERASVIAKLEGGAMLPRDDLVRRLERALDIKLREKAPEASPRKATDRGELTLGDLMELEGEE